MSDVERMLPLYEAKMVHHYDHRWATYEPDGSTHDVTLDEKQDPDFVVLPRYWVRESVVAGRLAGRWDRDSLLGWRNVCRSTDERTMVCGRFPTTAVGHSMPIVLAGETAVLQAIWSTFVFDFVARQKVGGINMTFGFVAQFATLAPEDQVPWSLEPGWLSHRAEWLQAPTSWRDIDRRASVRAELDAAMFHLYGIHWDDVDYIMETFPIVRRKDIAAHGEYRTKRLILEIYDRMADAIASGHQCVSALDPSDAK